MRVSGDPRPKAWSPAFKVFHWATVALMLALLVLGWLAVIYPLSPAKLALFKWHKSLGLLLFAWVILWLAWRAARRTPALPEGTPSYERWATYLAHSVLFAVMIAMSLSGWIINSAANFPLEWFGLFRVPQIVQADKGLESQAELVHLALFWTLLGVLAIHIAAALWHHFVRRDDVLRRMLPFTKIENTRR